MKQLAPAAGTPAEIIEPIERAVRADRVTALAATLAELNSRGLLDDESLFLPAQSDRYVRKLLWRDPADRFVLIGITWPPDFATPLHDHAGLWGAEAVVSGTMRESNYRAIESDDVRGTRFARGTEAMFPERAVGILVPPFEYHVYHNVTDAVARTVHVYSGPLETCNTYTPSTGDWWTAHQRTLHYDA